MPPFHKRNEKNYVQVKLKKRKNLFKNKPGNKKKKKQELSVFVQKEIIKQNSFNKSN